MVIARAMHKRAVHAKDCDVAMRRQAVAFRLAEVGDKDDFGLQDCRRAQNSKPARFDQS